MKKETAVLLEYIICFTIDHFQLKKYRKPILLHQMEIIMDEKFRKMLFDKYKIVTIKWDGKNTEDDFNIYLYINNININNKITKIDVQYLVNGINNIFRYSVSGKELALKVINISGIID